jgi:hypothetical protein
VLAAIASAAARTTVVTHFGTFRLANDGEREAPGLVNALIADRCRGHVAQGRRLSPDDRVDEPSGCGEQRPANERAGSRNPADTPRVSSTAAGFPMVQSPAATLRIREILTTRPATVNRLRDRGTRLTPAHTYAHYFRPSDNLLQPAHLRLSEHKGALEDPAMLRPRSVAIGLVLLVATTSACSNDDTSGPPNPPQAIRIAVSSQTVSITCSGTGSLTASLTREGGFEGMVTLMVEGLPEGVSAMLSPDHLSGTTTTTSISLLVDATAVPGSYEVSVIAAASIGQVSATYTLILMEPPVEQPDFSLDAAPPELTIPVGQSGTTTIEIARVGGFQGTVALSLATPLPVGIEGTFTPPSTEGNTATLTLDVGPSVWAGRYPIIVRGTSSSLGARNLTIALTVSNSDWGLEVQPSVIAMRAGTGVMAVVQINPSDDMTIPPVLYLDSPPSGITATFPMFYLDWTFDMQLSVAHDVIPGTYQMTLKADLNSVTHSAPFTLMVTEDFRVTLAGKTHLFEHGPDGLNAVQVTRRHGWGAGQVPHH